MSSFVSRIARAPATVDGETFVRIPAYDGGEQLFGPCIWTPHYGAGTGGVVLPAVDDLALVTFDDQGTVWIVEWRSAVNPSPVGGGGGGITEEEDPVAMPALAAHEADTTNVHGITDTTVLATDVEVAAAVSTHEADTLGVHGIADTSALVLTSDARLSDQRTPLDNSVTSAKIADGAVGQSDLADGSVIEAKIANLAVTTGKLANSAVTTAKIADANVTSGKLASGLSLTGGLTVTGALTQSGGAASFRNPSTANNAWGVLSQLDGAATGLRFLFLAQSNANVAADNEFYVLDNGNCRADGTFTGGGADYAEWFEHDAPMKMGDVVGLNQETGRVRKYQKGDPLVGVVSEKPAFAAGAPTTIEEDVTTTGPDAVKAPLPAATATHTLVALIGQVDVDPAQVILNKRAVLTTADKRQLGFKLSNGKVFITALGLMSIPGGG